MANPHSSSMIRLSGGFQRMLKDFTELIPFDTDVNSDIPGSVTKLSKAYLRARHDIKNAFGEVYIGNAPIAEQKIVANEELTKSYLSACRSMQLVQTPSLATSLATPKKKTNPVVPAKPTSAISKKSNSTTIEPKELRRRLAKSILDVESTISELKEVFGLEADT